MFAGGPFNIDGYAYTIAASAFSNNVYNFDEEQWSQSLALTSRQGDGTFDWRIVATAYDYDTANSACHRRRCLRRGRAGQGSITRGDGTGWQTLDAKGVWRPAARRRARSQLRRAWRPLRADQRALHHHELDHRSGRRARQRIARQDADVGALGAGCLGLLATHFTLIAGGRFESWKAYDGFNYSASPRAQRESAGARGREFSPKASLEWEFAPDWSAKASIGQAYRFPTVGELYQAITAGATLTVPNPNLRPENALSTEWSLERALRGRQRAAVGLHRGHRGRADLADGADCSSRLDRRYSTTSRTSTRWKAVASNWCRQG